VGAVKGELEIPLLLSFLYLFSEAELGPSPVLPFGSKRRFLRVDAIRSEDSVRRGV
jgi:hypothetical protein